MNRKTSNWQSIGARNQIKKQFKSKSILMHSKIPEPKTWKNIKTWQEP